VMAKDGTITESEGEEEVDDFRQVTLAEDFRTRGNILQEKSAIRLTEIGPRMTLSLFKIEEGLMEGEILYHSLINKSPKELDRLRVKKRQQLLEKSRRRKEQEENVRKKRLPFEEEGNVEVKSKNPNKKVKL